MKKKGSVLICLLCIVFLVLGLAACDKGHKHTTCEICGLCTDTSCTGSASEKCQGHNTGGDETGGDETGGDNTGGDDPIIGEDPIIKDGLTYRLDSEKGVATITAADSSFNGDIPSKVKNSSQGKEYSVTRIEAKIGNSTITKISIPDSMTYIVSGAFSNCSGLTSATIPTLAISYIPKSNLKTIVITSGNSIDAGAFKDCSSLTNITIPDSVTSIGSYAFDGFSGITSATIPTLAISYIPKSNLKTIIITSGSSIGYNAFSGCSGLTSIKIPDSVTSIGDDAFEGTAWYNNQPNGLVYAGKVAYTYKGTMPSNTEIIIKDGTLGIADYAFNGCSGLTSITIPDSVTSIGENAFWNCSSLTSITIPDSVTSIGENAFYNCRSLTDIQFSGTTEQWKAISKGSNWNYNTGNYTIICTDGVINK